MARVLILGAGPAGLLAAETVIKNRGSALVASRPEPRSTKPMKSLLYGCQYLHAPGFFGGLPSAQVTYRLEGSSEGYRTKVYGENWSGAVSPDEYGKEESHTAWDLRKAYDTMWDFWQHRVLVTPSWGLTAASLERTIQGISIDLVISTIPAPALCRRNPGDGENPHNFRTQKIWAMGEAPGREVPVPCRDNEVVCNGDRFVGWYRKARVFGSTTVEWPWRDGKKPPFKGVVEVKKPLGTDCDCWLNEKVPFLRVGRYGRWEKGYLVHQVVEDVEKALSGLRS